MLRQGLSLSVSVHVAILCPAATKAAVTSRAKPGCDSRTRSSMTPLSLAGHRGDRGKGHLFSLIGSPVDASPRRPSSVVVLDHDGVLTLADLDLHRCRRRRVVVIVPLVDHEHA